MLVRYIRRYHVRYSNDIEEDVVEAHVNPHAIISVKKEGSQYLMTLIGFDNGREATTYQPYMQPAVRAIDKDSYERVVAWLDAQ